MRRPKPDSRPTSSKRESRKGGRTLRSVSAGRVVDVYAVPPGNNGKRTRKGKNGNGKSKSRSTSIPNSSRASRASSRTTDSYQTGNTSALVSALGSGAAAAYGFGPSSPSSSAASELKRRVVTDRQYLESTLRIGCGRQEDVALLRRLIFGDGDGGLGERERQRFALECGFREEWRIGEEDGHLRHARSSPLYAEFSPEYLALVAQMVSVGNAGDVSAVETASAGVGGANVHEEQQREVSLPKIGEQLSRFQASVPAAASRGGVGGAGVGEKISISKIPSRPRRWRGGGKSRARDEKGERQGYSRIRFGNSGQYDLELSDAMVAAFGIGIGSGGERRDSGVAEARAGTRATATPYTALETYVMQSRLEFARALRTFNGGERDSDGVASLPEAIIRGSGIKQADEEERRREKDERRVAVEKEKKKRLDERTGAALVIQARIREYQERQRRREKLRAASLLRRLHCANTLQRFFRAKLVVLRAVRSAVKTTRQKNSATVVQRSWRLRRRRRRERQEAIVAATALGLALGSGSVEDARRRHASTRIQAFARSWLCRRRALWWALAIHRLRARRRRMRDMSSIFPLSSWSLPSPPPPSLPSSSSSSTCPSSSSSSSFSSSSTLSYAARKARSLARQRQRRLGNKLVLWRVQFANEARAVELEADEEIRRMRKAWGVWNRKMTRSVLKRSLQSHWGDRYVEQQKDDGTGVEFLDLKDGTVRTEHPNMRLVEQTRRKQRPRMEKTLARRLAGLKAYREKLVDAERAHRAQCERALRRVEEFLSSQPTH